MEFFSNFQLKKWTFALALALITFFTAEFSKSTEFEPVYLYGVEFTRSDINLQIAKETYKAIESAIAPRKLIISNIPLNELDEILQEKRASIVITNSGIYRRHMLNGWRDVVTLSTTLQPDPDHAVGSLLLARKGLGIKTLEDLKGRSIALNTPSAFQGTLTLKKELIDQNYDPEKFFGKISYMGTKPEARMNAVKNGLADSTFISTCYLERTQRKTGRNIAEEFDLVNSRVIPGNLCFTSTDLYPNFTVLTSPNLDPQTIRRIAQALLKIPPNSDGEFWTLASDYAPVDNVYKTLKAGPYQYLNSWTIQRVWEEFQTLIWLLALTLLFVIWHIWRTGQVVNKATKEIIEATAEQKKNIAKTQSIRNALLVSGLSNMVAHEISQPLAASLLYAKSIKKILGRLGLSNKQLETAADGLIEQTERANSIVDLVRKYAKTKYQQPEKIKANEAIKRTVENFIRDHPESKGIFKLSLCHDDKVINIAPVEFDIAISNLIKNSYQALQEKEDPIIQISSKSYENKFEIEIRDNSGTLTEEKFKKLELPFSSTKMEGLGLGISIVRSIFARHYIQLIFERDSSGSLVSKIIFTISNKTEES